MQDFRDVRDGPFDAISSIGMSNMSTQVTGDVTQQLFDLLRPGGRFSITRSADPSPSMTTRPSKVSELSRQMQIALAYATSRSQSFIERYVFPTASSKRSARWSRCSRPTVSRSVTREPSRALRTHAAPLGRQLGEAFRRGRRGGRRRACPRLASLHVGFGLRLRTTHLEIHQILCAKP